MHLANMRAVILLSACLSTTAVAQTVTGNLDGHVVDPAGAAVAGARILARSTTTGIERTTQTDQAGYFEIAFLPVGGYNVTVSMKGFATLIAQGNQVSLNKTTTLSLTLQVSDVQASVTVNDAAPLIDLTSGQISRGIDDVMVSQL